jgi:hypothetical protein
MPEALTRQPAAIIDITANHRSDGCTATEQHKNHTRHIPNIFGILQTPTELSRNWTVLLDTRNNGTYVFHMEMKTDTQLNI